MGAPTTTAMSAWLWPSLLFSAALWAPSAVADDVSVAVPAASTPAPTDTEGPSVVDLSIAADNPDAAPVVTTMLKDNVGVASAVVHWRVPGQPWQQTPLQGGTGPLRIARLPDGPQRTGFSAWIEAKDGAGNVTRVASEGAPLEVVAAVEGNSERVSRQTADDEAIRGPHPAWVMLAMATGIAGTAGAGVFVYDINIINKRSDEVAVLLDDGGISASRRAELEGTQLELQRVLTQDTAIAATLGVIGAAALVTGVTLLVFAAVEQ